MKIIYYLIFTFFFMVSCNTPQAIQIGKVNMISNRNIELKSSEYSLLASYSGASKKELNRTRAITVEDAIDQTVRRVTGGEFLMNAKIYMIPNGLSPYFAVEGDVWGTSTVGNHNYRGFKIGDIVMFKSGGNYVKCKLTAIKDENRAVLERLDNKTIIDVRFDNIIKYDDTKLDEEIDNIKETSNLKVGDIVKWHRGGTDYGYGEIVLFTSSKRCDVLPQGKNETINLAKKILIKVD